MTSSLRRFLLLFFVLILFSLSASPLKSSSNARIVAIGDVHGAYEAFVSILRESQLVNEKNQWSAGNTIFVQAGDILDRGPDSRKVMDLLMALQKEAPRQKGKVIAILGNHEVMNLIGDLRYVSPEEYASYSNSQSINRQESAYDSYERFMTQRAKKLGKVQPAFTKESKDEWKKNHPPGFMEHREAFAINGKYGKWLRKLNAIQKIDDSIFLHGGISPAVSEFAIDAMNRRIHQEIGAFDNCAQVLQHRKAALGFFTLDEILDAAHDELEMLKNKPEEEDSTSKQLQKCLNMNSWLSIHPEGPLWFRGYTTWSDTEGAEQVNKLLVKYKATRFVTGHTVQSGGLINARFDGKLILIDTGMLSTHYAGGRASALEINNGKVTAIYSGKREVLRGN